MPQSGDAPLRGIKDVASDLGVTARTLRFYEDRGLIEPLRVGSTRVYRPRDVGRMQLILRGKRLGFSLREIQEFLDLYDADPDHVEQVRLLEARTRERLNDLEHQRTAIDKTIIELREIVDQARGWLAEHERRG